MAIFGISVQLDPLKSTVVFIALLGLLLLLEYALEHLQKSAERHGYVDILDKLKKELMMLGIVSFTVFLYGAFSEVSTHSVWYLSFELTHIIIFFIALAFILQSTILVHFVVTGGREVMKATRTSAEELLNSYESLKNSCSSCGLYAFQKFPSFIPFYPTFRSYCEYKVIEKSFLKSYKLPKNFAFAKYVAIMFRVYMSELLEVSPFNWFVLACLVVINFIRAIYIDPHLKTLECPNYGSDSSSHHRLLSTTMSPEGMCVYYLLKYAFALGICITVYIFIVFIMSSIYYDRMIFRCLKFEGFRQPSREERLIAFVKAMNEAEEPSDDLELNSADAEAQAAEADAIQKEIEEEANKRMHEKEVNRDRPLVMKLFHFVIHCFLREHHSEIFSHEMKHELKKLYVGRSSRAFFKSVEYALLFQCFYIALWSTQLIPLSIETDYIPQYVIALTAPIVANFILLRLILHRSVLLQCITEIHPESLATVFEESNLQTTIVSHIQKSIREALEKLNKEQKIDHVRELFEKFDVDHSQTISSIEFRELLGHFKLYMSRRNFQLMWEVIDIDLSDTLTWDEFFVLVFPELKEEIKKELKIVEELRKAVKEHMLSLNVPESQWRGKFIEKFQSFDVDNSGTIDEEEFRSFVTDMGLSNLSEKSFRLLFAAVDAGTGGKITFEEVYSLLLSPSRPKSGEYNGKVLLALPEQANNSTPSSTPAIAPAPAPAPAPAVPKSTHVVPLAVAPNVAASTSLPTSPKAKNEPAAAPAKDQHNSPFIDIGDIELGKPKPAEPQQRNRVDIQKFLRQKSSGSVNVNGASSQAKSSSP